MRIHCLYPTLYIFLCTLAPARLCSFDTVQDLLAYAKSVEEFPDSDLDSQGVLAQENPTFSAFYRIIDPGFFGQIAYTLNISKPLWSFADFTTTLQDLYKHQQQNPWFAIDTNAIKGVGLAAPHLIGCTATEDTNLIVVGELSGAFHSLAHIVKHWQKSGVIDEHFTVHDKNMHIVFLGDLIGTSAYNLETLTAVATILIRNPRNVWYLCGSTEDRQRWHQTPLYHAINVRSGLQKEALRAIYQAVNNLFALLPKAFLIMSKSQEEAIACASSQVFETLNPEDIYYCSKTLNSTDIQGCTVQGKIHSTHNKISIVALLEDKRAWTTAAMTPPLEKITVPSIKGTVWDLVSGTTRALRATYLFRWSGYFVLKPRGEHLQQSTLEYIGKHLGDDAFKHRETYNVVSGELISEPEPADATQNTTSKTPLPE